MTGPIIFDKNGNAEIGGRAAIRNFSQVAAQNINTIFFLVLGEDLQEPYRKQTEACGGNYAATNGGAVLFPGKEMLGAPADAIRDQAKHEARS